MKKIKFIAKSKTKWNKNKINKTNKKETYHNKKLQELEKKKGVEMKLAKWKKWN